MVLNDKENTKRMSASMWSLMMLTPADDRAVTRRKNCWWMVSGMEDQARCRLAVSRNAMRYGRLLRIMFKIDEALGLLSHNHCQRPIWLLRRSMDAKLQVCSLLFLGFNPSLK